MLSTTFLMILNTPELIPRNINFVLNKQLLNYIVSHALRSCQLSRRDYCYRCTKELIC